MVIQLDQIMRGWQRPLALAKPAKAETSQAAVVGNVMAPELNTTS